MQAASTASFASTDPTVTRSPSPGNTRAVTPCSWSTASSATERSPAAISVGTTPTFEGERERRVESYVLDRDDRELYGVEVEVAFVDRLRGMVKFEGIEALIDTMRDDVRRAREVLGA